MKSVFISKIETAKGRVQGKKNDTQKQGDFYEGSQSIRNEILGKGYQGEETQGYKAMKWTFYYRKIRHSK